MADAAQESCLSEAVAAVQGEEPGQNRPRLDAAERFPLHRDDLRRLMPAERPEDCRPRPRRRRLVSRHVNPQPARVDRHPVSPASRNGATSDAQGKDRRSYVIPAARAEQPARFAGVAAPKRGIED